LFISIKKLQKCKDGYIRLVAVYLQK
jgi:hypothetical protein